MDVVPPTPLAIFISSVGFLLVVAVIAVLLVPSLRARRWLVWSVLGVAGGAAISALIWTYTI
jgi:hypothetical protein